MNDNECPECLDCGLCCKMMMLSTDGMSPEDLNYWATKGRTVGRAIVVDTRCRQLTPNNRCSIYDLRPVKCRAFDKNGPACRAMRHAWDESLEVHPKQEEPCQQISQ